MRYFVEISFDGSEYYGWQRNSPFPTISETIERELAKILGEPVKVVGCTRTDAGVHALSYFFHFDYKEIDIGKVQRGLQALLPSSIWVKRIFQVSDRLHARFSAVSRAYIYLITTVKNPFIRKYAYLYGKKLDLDFLNELSRVIEKNRDFKSFQTQGSPTKTTLVDVKKAFWGQGFFTFPPIVSRYQLPLSKDEVYFFYIEANRFLYKMVRNLVGTMLYFNSTKKCVEDFIDIIEARDRRRAFAPAPAHGLYLLNVSYNEGSFTF